MRVYVCHRHGKKMKKKSWKNVKRVLKCCLLKKGSKTMNSALKSCLSLPLVFLSWFLLTKVNSKSQFHYFAYYAWRTFVFPILSLLTNTPSPVTTLNFYLECYVFQFVEFEFGMSIWCYWFSHLSSSIPFMRSYLNMLINSGNYVLCDTYMWAFVFISTSILSHITSIGCVVRKSEWK